MGSKRTVEFIASDLNAHDLSMVAYPSLYKAQLSKRIFSGFDSRQGLACYRTSVFNAGGQARRSRFVPHLETSALGQGANLSLGECRFCQGTQNAVLLSSALSWTKISLVIEVLAVGNVPEAQLVAFFFHDGKEFIFTLEAASRIVARVLWPFHLLGCNYL